MFKKPFSSSFQTAHNYICSILAAKINKCSI